MTSNLIIVQKYGGACLETPDKIRAVASALADLHNRGHRVVVIVSAMGKTTDDLVQMAYLVSAHPNRRELDMLLTTGERISMSLMSMALSDLGVPAISFTGSQAGVMTDESHSSARILDVRPNRVREELDRGRIVVLAGFQGVSDIQVARDAAVISTKTLYHTSLNYLIGTGEEVVRNSQPQHLSRAGIQDKFKSARLDDG